MARSLTRIDPTRHSVTRRRRFGLTAMKRFMYSQMQLMGAVKVAFGRDTPLVRFTVEADPPSAYVNFAVRADRVDAFAAHCGIPSGLELAPIRCIETDEPFVCLTANIYRVSGLAHGVRLEWSTYVHGDRPGVPRYMVVGAVSSLFSIDPVDIFTPTGECTYERTGNHLAARAQTSVGEFLFDFDLEEREPDTLPTRQWVEANDLIYWTNGVCDRVYYDAGFHNTPMWNVDPTTIGLKDTTEWAEWVEPVPRHALFCSDSLDLVMSPWWNLGDLR